MGVSTEAAAHATRPAAINATRELTAGETAWLAVIPCAALTLSAIVLLGPPIGRLLPADESARFWEALRVGVRPEPTEHGRYVAALGAPLLLAALVLAGARRPWRATRTARALVAASQLAMLGFAVVCVLRQHEVFGALYPPDILLPPLHDYFPFGTLAAAAAGALAVMALLGNARLRSWAARWTRETRGRAWVAGSMAVLAVVVWLLHVVYTDATIAVGHPEVVDHLRFTLDETFAVLNGRSPLVDYVTQYGALWSYVFAGGLWAIGPSVGAWIGMAACATGLGMIAIYAVLRRAAQSSINGLLLFLPVLATSFLMVDGPAENRYTFGNYFGTFPMRYAGPSILAWLVARHLVGARPRRAGVLFFAAGIVVLNNVDVGLPTLGATVAALLWGAGRLTRRQLARLALHAGVGLGAAYAVVALFILARAGTLPDIGLLFRFSRLFAAAGFGMYAMPPLGFHIVIYLTFVAAIGVATVRALRGAENRTLTGMLAWSGVFGLGAGAYFVGRSTPDDIVPLFFPWSFAVALMTIASVRALAGRSWRMTAVPIFATIAAFLLTALSLAQTPKPWEQLRRFDQSNPPILARPAGQDFIAQHTQRGSAAAILTRLGHRVGANLGISNVSPYANSLSMPTAERFEEAIAALRAAGGRNLYLESRLTTEDMATFLQRAGFVPAAADPNSDTRLWIDARGR
jgi:hypothetical protein